jgi:hypothetical protein
MRRIGVVLLALSLVAALLPSAGSADVKKWPDSGFSLVFEDGTALEFGMASGLDLETAFGVGMPPVDNITTPYAILDGSVYQRSITRNRTITLVIRANGKSQHGLQVLRSRLIEAVNPHRLTLPIRLQYRGASRVLYIEGYYAGGLELPADWRTGFERIALQLLCVEPYWRMVDATTAALAVRQTIANTNYIAQRSLTGAWNNMLNGADDIVYALEYDLQGRLYAGGAFHNIGGVAAAHIARWTGTIWEALGVGCDNNVGALARGPDGNIYVGGLFHNAGGGAAAHVARYNVAAGTFSALGAGCDDQVTDLKFTGTGELFAGGLFLNAGGGAALHAATWNGAAWAALGAGLDGNVVALSEAPNGDIYYVGLFVNVAGGGIVLNHVARWSPTTATWYALGTGVNNNAHAILVMRNGRIVVGGEFTTAGGLSASRVAQWNGISWSAMSTGFNSVPLGFIEDSDGLLHAVGWFSLTGTRAIPQGHAIWRNGIWIGADNCNTSGNIVQYIIQDSAGLLTIGGRMTGALAYPGYQTITNPGSASTWPVLIFVGPGPLYQLINYTTGKRIDFNLTLLAGETVTLDLRQGVKTLTSNFRGNLMASILPGDLTTWCLAPGANYVAVWIDDATATGTISYVPYYWSLDGATD